MNPRKYPRTMQEAFGPYTSFHIDQEYTPIHKHDKIVMVGSVLAAIVLILLALFDVLK